MKTQLPHLNSCTSLLLNFSELSLLIYKMRKLHSWPLHNAVVRGSDLLHNPKFMYNFWLPKSITTNCLQLTGSLTNNMNSWLMHFVCYMYYMLCYYNKARKKKMFSQTVANLQKVVQYFYWKNTCIRRPA